MQKKTLFATLFHQRYTLLLAIVWLLSSCREDEIRPSDDPRKVAVNETNHHINSWILENMQYWYFWNEDVPEDVDKDLDPAPYFNALLHPDDRFSWIQDNYLDLINSIKGISKEAGYEYALYLEKEGSNHVILQLLYTKAGSPAEKAGLKRGDVVTHINGQQITTSNYQTLAAGLSTDHTLRYKPIAPGDGEFGTETTVSLSAVEYAENPNYLHKVIEASGKKIGYFVYNFFASGTDDRPGQYDAEMDAVFADFKAQGITELVLDLRFNSGGTETSAKNLASLIARGAGPSTIFLKRQYNSLVQDVILNDEDLGEEFLVSYFDEKSNNIGNQLSGGRVYVLTSARTASASELVINALKPFMEVFIIGDTTMGKNVGSISLYQEDDPKNRWGMQPIVVKVFNSLDQSDYGTGFAPDVLHKDNNLYLYPLGDPREALLAQAIGQITGTATTSRQAQDRRTLIGHSLDFKRRGFNLITTTPPH